jgi:glycosyltransferase involved in cell wall biosynthesis
MPLFNAVETLPDALASLQAQTYNHWECIIVDDGSTDNPSHVINLVSDSRIQYHSLDRNHGRGFARQYALGFVQGKYLTFLDADDWLYPDKFSVQVEILEAEPDIAMVSTGMAISNSENKLVGVRGTAGPGLIMHSSMKHLSMPPLPFAPSMMLASLAIETGFDASFPTAEDADFIIRALLGKRYAVIPGPYYVYREQGSTTLNKVSLALYYCCRMFQKQYTHYPLRSSIEIFKARGKQLIYHSASILGLWDSIIARRSRLPSEADREQFQKAYHALSCIVSNYVLEDLGVLA